MSHRVAPLLLGIILVVAHLATGIVSHPAAAHPPGYGNPLTNLPAAGDTVPLATPATQDDAMALCDEGGYVQFTPDGSRPFTDTAACLCYAAEHGGPKGLIRRVSVVLSDYGTGLSSTYARFTVMGLVPYRQYLATMRIQGGMSDSAPLVFRTDENGDYTGQVSTSASPHCAGGIKLFVEVTTLTGYSLGTNGTFLPC